VLSLPIILKGEAWGVLQLVEPIPRTWKRGEISRAQNHVDQLRISLLERFIATGSNFPEGLLATILTTGSGRSSIRTVEGTVLCLDLIKSRELLLDDTVHHPHVLASMTGYFEAAIRIAETFDGRVVGTAGDALVFFFEGGTQALREQRAISCLREIAEQFAKRRNESAVDVGMLGVPPQSGRTLWFHGAIASGSIEVGLLPSRAGPVLCSLGNPLHTAFAMTKEIGLHVDPEVIQVPGVAVV
jgi:class 3 adenylate cyclase